MTSLDLNTITELLKPQRTPAAPKPPTTHRVVIEQYGPLRWFDTEMRCVSRGCSSPTYCKLEGVPYCTMHALKLMNELLIRYEGLTTERS